MKKIVILFFSIFSLFAQDIQKEVKDYASQHSNNVCCNDLLNLFKIKPDLGKYGPLADLIFSKLCIQTDENNMTVLSNGIEIAGKTSFKEKLIDAKMRIIQETNNITYAIGLSLPNFKISDLDISLKNFDILSLKNAIIVLSNSSVKDKFFDVSNFDAGMTVEASLVSTEIITQTLGPVGKGLVNTLRLRVSVPITAKSIQDVRVNLVSAADTQQQLKICLNELPAFGELSSIALLSPLMKTCLTTDSLSVLADNKGKLAISLVGAITFLGTLAKIEIHLKDGHYIMGIKIARFDDLIKNVPGLDIIGEQIKQLFIFKELKLVTSDTTGVIQLKSEIDKPKSTSEEISEEDLAALFGDEVSAEPEGIPVNPGLNITGIVQSSGYLKDALSGTNLAGMYINMFLPAGKSSYKDIKTQFKPLAKTDEGLCVGSFLTGVLQKIDLDQLLSSLAAPLNLICFGTEIGLSFNTDMQPVFFISGPIKKYPSISAMIKLSKAPKDSPTKFIVTFGMKGYSFKLSDIIKIKGLDVFELKTPVLFMTNGQNQSAFDIENGMINPNTIGAITRLNSGVTIESELASKGILTTILGSFLNKLGSALRLRVYIPSTAKSAKDVKISFVPEEDKPIKLCLKDFSILNQLPNFFNKIQNSCFESSSLSVAIDEKGKAAVSVIGTASILNVPSKIEAHLKDGHYIMGIKVASLNTLINEIPGLSLVNKQFDKIFSLTELELIASDTTGSIQLKPEKYKKEPADEFSDEDLMALFGEDLGEAEASGLDVVPGVSLLARLTVTNVVPLIKDLLASISLDPAQIQINIPPGAQKIQDVKIRLKPEDPTQQVCISRAIIPILKLVDVGSLGDKLSSILSILCLGTDFNIVFDNGMNMVVVVSGDLKKFGGKLMAKFTPQKKEAVLGVELAQQLKFEDISSVLKPLDNIMTLGTPTILLTNQQNATVFDIENGIINPNASTAIAVPYGLSLEIKLVPGAQTDAILKQMPISQKLLTLMRIRVLFTKTGPQVSFVRADHKPIEICLKDLPGIAQLPSNSIVNSIKDTCVTVNELTFDRGDNGLLFNINAKAKILGIDNVDLQIGVNGQQSLIAANIPQLNLAKLPAPFPSIANVISLTNTQLVISNYSANQTIFGTPTAVENGLNIIGDIAFENPFGQVLALFGIDRLRATISITKESGSEQVKISATKSIDKSFGNIVKCKNLTLNFLSGIPPKGPIFGLAIDSILSIGDKPLEIVFNVSLGASSIQISGELSCLKGAACPAIEKPFKMPITLRALPAGTAGFPQGLPISVTISMLGGAPVGLGGSGAFVLGDNNFVTNFYFDFSQPDLYGLMFRANQLCLDDIIQLFTLFLAQEVQKALGLSFIPDLFCLQNVDVSMASKSMTINKVALNQGVVASGDFIIPLLGNLKGLANFNLRVPTLELSTLSAIDKIGIFADGILEPLILSMGNINLFSLTGSSKDKQAKGPTLHLAVGKNNQEFNLSGKLNILNGFINDDVLIKIDKTKMSFDLKRDFAGISETISGTLGFDSSQLANISKMSTADIQQLLLNNWQIKGELNVEQLNNAITGNLKTVIAGWQSSLSVLSSVQETFLGACDKITGYLNPFFTFDCSSCLKNIGPLGAINTVLQTLTDWIKNLSTVFKLESASFTYSLQDLVNVKSPSYTVKYKLFGDEKTVTLQLDPTHPQKMIDTFFEIIKTAIQPADLANALKLVAKMGTDAAANIKKLLDTTFTCKFKTKFVKDNIDLSVSFNPMHPEQVVAQAMLNQLCLGDLLNLSDSFGASVPKITFPALGCLKNVTILISASKINIKGTMSILGLDSFVEGVIDGSGITLNGLLPSISILNDLFSLTDSTDSSKGPNFALVMTKDKQEIDLSGVLTVFKKISQVTDVIVSPQKLKFQMTGEVPGLTLDILGEAVSSFPLKNMKINATVKNKLDELVLAGVKSGTSLLKSGAATVFKEIDQIFSDIKHKVDDAPVVGGLLSGLVSKAGSVVNRAKVPLDLLNKTIDQFLDSFGIDSIVLSGDINAFDTNTTSPVKVSILYHLGSSNKNLKIDVLFGSADFVSVLIKKIAEDVVTNIKNAVTDPNKQLKDFKNNMSDILKEVIKEVANAIGAFFEDIANKAGEAVLELGKDVLNIANNAAELALNIANQIGDALGNASEVINEALKASADAASDAAQVAAKAAGKAAEEAAKVAAKAAEEATKVAGKAAEEAGKAVGKAAVAAAKAAAKAVSDAMKDVADFFGF